MTYSEKLKDPRWQKRRLEILNRDNFTCQSCFDDESTLHVHHLHYFPNKEPWDIDNDYLVTLCETCHAWEGECYRDRLDDLVLILKSRGLLSHQIHALSNLITACDLIHQHPDFRILTTLLTDRDLIAQAYKKHERLGNEYKNYLDE